MGFRTIVVTATWAEEPFIYRRHLRPGMHITTLGADQPGKCEVASDALRAARVIVDDHAPAVATGAVGNAGLRADAVHAELGEIVTGIKPGRLDDGEITQRFETGPSDILAPRPFEKETGIL